MILSIVSSALFIVSSAATQCVKYVGLLVRPSEQICSFMEYLGISKIKVLLSILTRNFNPATHPYFRKRMDKNLYMIYIRNKELNQFSG